MARSTISLLGLGVRGKLMPCRSTGGSAHRGSDEI
jgi:hypothetical protein